MRLPIGISRALVVALITTSACGGASSSPVTGTRNTNPPPPPGTPNSVVITNNSFTPTDLSVATGATVTWTWDTCSGGDGYGNGQTCVSHNVTFDDGTASGSQSGGSYSRTFGTAGTYMYHCTIHGAAAMSGRVVVQ